jgi:hypothetical protein
MIDSLMNMIFRCGHRRLSGPMAPARTPGISRNGHYLVCLDCGKRFAYDTETMQVGKPIETPDPEHRAGNRM